MFQRKTVFVVGAGASTEVGMPVGATLANIIATRLDIRFRNNGAYFGPGEPAKPI